MNTSLQVPRPRTRNWAFALALSAGVTLTSCGGGSDCGGPFCIGLDQPRATRLAMGSGDGQTGAPSRELPNSLVVLVTDDNNRPVPDVVVTFSIAPGGGSVSGAQNRTDVQGRAWATWTLGTEPGTQTAQAAASGQSGSPLSGSPLIFSAHAVRPPPARIVLRQAPSVAARNGIPLEQQPILEVLDADQQPVPQVQVVAAIASGGGTLSGTISVVSDASGRATYTDLALVGPGGSRTLKFSIVDPALEVVSGAIIVGAGGPAVITGIPPLTYQRTVGSPVDPPPSVVVKDAANNPVPGVAVSFTGDRDASISPETVNTDDHGVAQLTNWTLGTAANVQYTLTARVEGSTLVPVRFTAMARAGAAGGLRISAQPSATGPNGSPFAQQPVIQVVDRDGNPAPQAGVQITASIAAGPNGALQNPTATTGAGGQATFNGLTLTGAVGNYTISFSAQGLAGAMSNPVTLTAGPAAQLAFVVAPPSTGRSRAALNPQPMVQVQDGSGNPVPQSAILIVASVDGGATLSGPTAATDATGKAAFTQLAIIGAPGPKILSFSSPSSALPTITAQVTLPDVARIEPHPATPPSGTVGTTLTAVPIAILTDVHGDPVADASFTLSPNAGTVSVLPAKGTSGDGGVVTADSWTLGTATGDQGVVIQASGSVTPLTVKIQGTAGAPNMFVKVSGDNPVQSAPPGTDLALPFVVRVVDQYNNGVPGTSVQWRACDGSVEKLTTTVGDGSASIVVTTGSQSSCVNAYSPGAAGPQVNGSPVTFTYTVPAAASMSRSRSFKGPVFTPVPH